MSIEPATYTTTRHHHHMTGHITPPPPCHTIHQVPTTLSHSSLPHHYHYATFYSRSLLPPHYNLHQSSPHTRHHYRHCYTSLPLPFYTTPPAPTCYTYTRSTLTCYTTGYFALTPTPYSLLHSYPTFSTILHTHPTVLYWPPGPSSCSTLDTCPSAILRQAAANHSSFLYDFQSLPGDLKCFTVSLLSTNDPFLRL